MRACPSVPLIPDRAAYVRAYYDDMNVQIPDTRVESFAAITVLYRSVCPIVRLIMTLSHARNVVDPRSRSCALAIQLRATGKRISELIGT